MERFLEMYNKLNLDNLHLLGEVYSDNVHFVDPAHEIRGLDSLTSYFEGLYQNVTAINFDYRDVNETENSCYLQWDMKFRHTRFAGGKEILVSGATFIRKGSDGKVEYHRDYFDLGEMIYENLPLLGRLITAVKGRLGK